MPNESVDICYLIVGPGGARKYSSSAWFLDLLSTCLLFKVIDDLVATGGTLIAACDLMTSVGFKVMIKLLTYVFIHI